MTDELVDERAPADDGVMRLISVELPGVVDDVLAQPRIQQSCAELQLDPAELRARLLAESDALLSPTNAEISAYRDAVRELGTITPAEATVGDRRAPYEFILLLTAPAIVLGGAALLGAIYGGGLPLAGKIGLTVLVAASSVPLYFGLSIGALLNVLDSPRSGRTSSLDSRAARRTARVGAWAITAVGTFAFWSSFVRLVTAQGAVVAVVIAVLAIGLQMLSISGNRTPGKHAQWAQVRAKATVALDHWREAARQAVEPAVSRLISTLAAPSYDVRLTVRDASRLGVMASTDLAVETVATQHFQRVLAGMQAGAVGIAGPRGVGKTTLLEAHREGRLLPPGREHLLVRVDAPIGYEGRDFALHVYAVACQSVIGYKNTRRPLRKRVFRRRPRAEKEWLAHVEEAVRKLEKIRYLQTKTTGWSGKLTMSAGDVTATRSTAKARQPLTYPEIIAELREFLEETARVLAATNPSAAATPLVVAVDELDKIATAEHAHRFVNELKALFGVPWCHFVLSVSEDALISFERRGFAVRDAFDSAFDEIIRVEQLTLPESRKMLSSRLIGLSEPFVCFAHCFSGGLPRDLIRVARAMMDIAHATPAPSLNPVCLALTGTAIQQAARLAQRELRPAGHAGSVVDLVRLADGPALARQSPGELLATVEKLAAATDEPDEVAGVRLELVTFLYFALTVREVFHDGLTKDQIIRASAETWPGSFQTLGRARQAFGDNMMQAWLLVDQFRAAWNLPVVKR
ncbi:hypothetical protein [Amycolatopsis pithecellobii]|uniref:KAP NTPase domain-containing protein n=1 Tax=Amycolatopsis pithecellobii TaxID=664692 RepID=A0A6N7Z9T9_9PSEU|nr:hypothetical protein [Amycolatopsis pithecellobii]MTD58501.1 hypothetical protein [Amycolatopsis pithecellobii]